MAGGSIELTDSRAQDIPFPAGFYQQWGKRILDCAAAALGLLLLGPLLLLIAVLVRLTSAGPAFYLQQRVGKGGREFKIIKFRSMEVDAERHGPGITSGGDARVTPLGRILRPLKIDELPQLWNVLKGEMSLVGPRPELPHYVAGYTRQQRQVLTIRPGITDPAALAYRREEDLLARDPDPESFYRQEVLPHKLRLNLKYLEQVSFVRDLRLILTTIRSLLVHSRGQRQPKRSFTKSKSSHSAGA